MTGRRAGYLSDEFAASLAESGEPRRLPHSGGLLLVRPIPGDDSSDAIGGYRHLFCEDWRSLVTDLETIHDLVSLVAVPDPFMPLSEADLRRCFPDTVRAYKSNYVIDTAAAAPSRHHRAKARSASTHVAVSIHDQPVDLLDDWVALYGHLSERHAIAGLSAFSTTAFGLQLAAPGCVAFRAQRDGRPVAMMLWYVMGEHAHYHLGASSAAGYEVSATYALVAAAIDGLPDYGARYLNLGGAAGAEADESDGLSRFKRGWASETLTSYLCGRIFDRTVYARLCATANSRQQFFPQYRAPAA